MQSLIDERLAAEALEHYESAPAPLKAEPTLLRLAALAWSRLSREKSVRNASERAEALFAQALEVAPHMQTVLEARLGHWLETKKGRAALKDLEELRSVMDESLYEQYKALAEDQIKPEER